MNKEMPLLNLAQFATVLHNSVTLRVNRELAVYDLTYTDYALIGALLDNGEWSARELAPALAMDTSSISRIVTRLVDRGLITRRRPRCDRRVVLLKLTEAGGALGLEVQQIVGAHEERLTSGVDQEEIDTFLVVIRKIVVNCEAGAELSRSLQNDDQRCGCA